MRGRNVIMRYDEIYVVVSIIVSNYCYISFYSDKILLRAAEKAALIVSKKIYITL